jgi:hypothetical protein
VLAVIGARPLLFPSCKASQDNGYLRYKAAETDTDVLKLFALPGTCRERTAAPSSKIMADHITSKLNPESNLLLV